MKLPDIRDALLSVLPNNTFHYYAHKQTGNYIVWAEDTQGNASHADNRMKLQTIQGTIDYYTKTEFDPVFGQIQQAINSLGIAWRLNSIQHEEETDYIHYEWVFEFVSEEV